jgi:hypothetical protein
MPLDTISSNIQQNYAKKTLDNELFQNDIYKNTVYTSTLFPTILGLMSFNVDNVKHVFEITYFMSLFLFNLAIIKTVSFFVKKELKIIIVTLLMNVPGFLITVFEWPQIRTLGYNSLIASIIAWTLYFIITKKEFISTLLVASLINFSLLQYLYVSIPIIIYNFYFSKNKIKLVFIILIAAFPFFVFNLINLDNSVSHAAFEYGQDTIKEEIGKNRYLNGYIIYSITGLLSLIPLVVMFFNINKKLKNLTIFLLSYYLILMLIDIINSMTFNLPIITVTTPYRGFVFLALITSLTFYVWLIKDENNIIVKIIKYCLY